jgi:hypothetical protein
MIFQLSSKSKIFSSAIIGVVSLEEKEDRLIVV